MNSEPPPERPSADASRTLTASEAAYFLGITPELLFSYARIAPKKNDPSKRTLPHKAKDGMQQFTGGDLEQFDSYLQEPWSAEGEERPDIPSTIEAFLKVEAGGQCARCGRGHKITTAHIVPYAETRSHHHHNLIRLCSGCHDEYDGGLIARNEITSIKQSLIARTRERLLAHASNPGPRTGRVPNPAVVFKGRDDDVSRLAALLLSNRTVSVEGTPGIGKTQLVIHSLNRLSDQIPTFWISIEACESVSDIELALSVALSSSDNPVTSAMLFRHLDGMEARIIFDGVEQMCPKDMDDLTEYLQKLIQSTSKPRFVFTSQVELNDIGIDSQFKVAAISQSAGMEVLRLAYRPDSDQGFPQDHDLTWLNAFCDGHALSLQLAVGLLHHFKSPGVVANRVRQMGAAELQAPSRRRQTTETSLRACLLVSYETLSDDQRRLLWLVSQSPAGFVVDMAHALFDIPDPDAQIAELRRWHLLSLNDEGGMARLHALSPIRSFIIAEWENRDPQKRDDLLLEFIQALTFHACVLNFDHMQAGNAYYAVLQFDHDFTNFLSALRLATHSSKRLPEVLEFIPSLSKSLMVYCFVRGLSEQGYRILRVGAEAAIRLGDRRKASDLLVQAFALAQRSRSPSLPSIVAKELSRLATKSQDHQILGNAEFAEGLLAFEEHNYSQAIMHLDRASSHYEAHAESAEASGDGEDGTSFQRNLLMIMLGKAKAFERLERPKEALPILDRALDLVRRLNDQINIGSIEHHIGNCETALPPAMSMPEPSTPICPQPLIFVRLGFMSTSATLFANSGIFWSIGIPPHPLAR